MAITDAFRMHGWDVLHRCSLNERRACRDLGNGACGRCGHGGHRPAARVLGVLSQLLSRDVGAEVAAGLHDRTVPVRVKAGDGMTVVWHSPAELARLWAGVDREAVWALDGTGGEA